MIGKCVNLCETYETANVIRIVVRRMLNGMVGGSYGAASGKRRKK